MINTTYDLKEAIACIPTRSYIAECVHASRAGAAARESIRRDHPAVAAGSRRLRSTLAAVPVVFASAIVTDIRIGKIISPSSIASCAYLCCRDYADVPAFLSLVA
jgi:hypothetical protein